jgi:hypothetical protein
MNLSKEITYHSSRQQGLSVVKPVYKGHSREPENVAYMTSCPLIYTG